MALLYNGATGQYLDLTPQQIKELAMQNPQLQAQNVMVINGVGAIAVRGTITPNLIVLPNKNPINIYVGYGFWSGGLDGYQLVNAPVGQPIGMSTGTTGDYFDTVSVRLSVNLGGGKYKIGDIVDIKKGDIDLRAPSAGGGGGGNVAYPIRQGSKNSEVVKFQRWLINCGYNLGSWGADGDWGGATQTAASQEGITVINSDADLQRIITSPCKRQGGGGNPTGGGGGNPTGGGNETPITPTTPATTDNTGLWIAGGLAAALVVKNMMGKKKKGKKKKER